MQKPLSDAIKKQITKLHEKGFSKLEIHNKLGVATGSVSNVIHEGEEAVAPDLTPRLRAELSETKKKLSEALERELKLEQVSNLGTKLASAQFQAPKWSRPRHISSNQDDAVATSFLSDLHLDEVVKPEEIRGVNAYNREIAKRRLKKFFESTLQLTFDHMKGINVVGLNLPLGGDMFSGNIHEELRMTNETGILESLLYWSEQLVAGVKMLANEFDAIHIPCVVGNHGRMSMKPIMKNRARDNFDWFLYHLIARELREDPSVTFDISESADTIFQTYAVRYLLTHGDQFRGGGGIAGLLSPLMIGASRKSRRQQAINMPYDYMIMGHWHQYAQFKNIIVNGSLKGYDEFAFINNFDFEPPRQAYWLTQPRHGMTICGPLHVEDPDARY